MLSNITVTGLMVIMTFSFTVPVFSANHYIRSDASGSNNGSDWTNAWTAMPSTFTRGDTYYLADGTYGAYQFRYVDSGTDYVYVKKAIASDHGTDTGWDASYGDGQAVFSSSVAVRFSYLVIDGQIGQGDGNSVPYGIKITYVPGEDRDVNFTNYSNIPTSHVTLAYVDMEQSGEDTELRSMCMDLNAASYWTFSHCFFHDCNSAMVGCAGTVVHTTFEYCRWDTRHTNSEWHGEGIAWNSSSGTDAGNVIRYNTFKNVAGTGIIVIMHADHNGFDIYGNLFYTTSSKYFVGNGAITDVSSGGGTLSNIKVYNNTFVDIDGADIQWRRSGSGNEVQNNLFYNCGDLSNQGSVWSSNYYYNTTVNGGTSAEPNVMIGTASPFTDYHNDVFTLAAPTGNGTVLPPPFEQDLNAVYRGADGSWDRGAFEYTAAGIAEYGLRNTDSPSLLPNPVTSFSQLERTGHEIISLLGGKGSQDGIYLARSHASGQIIKIILVK